MSRMDWYGLVPTILRNELDQTARAKLQARVADLCTAILSYVMEMACRYSRTAAFGQNFRTLCTSEALEKVKQSEADLAVFDEDLVKIPVEQLLEHLDQPMTADTEGVEPKEPEMPNLLESLHVGNPWSNMTNGHDKDYKAPPKAMELFSKFVRWECTDERLLWISSGIGEGMTTVFLGLIHQFRMPMERDDELFHLSFFFFDHRSPAQDNPAAALRNLIWGILARQPRLERHLERKYETTVRESFDHANDFLALSGVFYDMIQDSSFSKTCFVVDALDECSSEEGCWGLEDLIRLINSSMQQSDKVRWLISSNYSSNMEKSLENCRHETLRDLSDVNILGDFIRSQAAKVASEKNYDSELKENVVQRLRQNPYCNYLWVDIVLNALRAEDIWQVTEFLDEMREIRDLESLYDHIRKTKILPSKDKDYCKQVLEVMAVVRHSLPISELEPLVQLKQRVDLKVIIGKCSAFLQTKDGIVSFQHQSAKDYVQRIFLNNNSTFTQMKLTRACFNLNWKKNKPLDCGKTDTQETKPSMSNYALVNWMSHLLATSKIACTSTDKDILDLFEKTSSDVCCFLQQHLVYWVDALVQKDMLATAASELQKLDLGFQHSEWKGLHTRIRDAHHFLRLHQATASTATLPASNTLLFCPAESLVRQDCLQSLFPWITSTPKAAQRWTGGLTTLKGHRDWVRAVVFSADGKLIVSGSDDSTVRVWDAETGLVQHSLEVNRGYIYSVAISSKGIVAVGSSDYSVTLWEVDAGRQIARFSEFGTINSLRFADDGNTLVAASSWGIWLYEALNGSDLWEKKPMDMIEDLVRSVALTSNGKLLAVAKDDCITIWDLENVSKIETIDGISSPVNSVAFSKSGNLLASGAEDGTIGIWTMGKYLEGGRWEAGEQLHMLRSAS
ncbi:hypothetical protein V8C44DRAFT_273994 [Trichoderma aethiopicum]